jgi:hypothetical protein
MTFARRLAAAAMALVLAVFPLALERCWTACVTPAVEAAPAASSAHACHEVSPGDDSGARMDPMSRACGHSDEVRVNASAGLAAAKTRTAVVLLAIEPVPRLHEAVGSARTSWWSVRSHAPRSALPLNSPLRL